MIDLVGNAAEWRHGKDQRSREAIKSRETKSTSSMNFNEVFNLGQVLLDPLRCSLNSGDLGGDLTHGSRPAIDARLNRTTGAREYRSCHLYYIKCRVLYL